MDAASFTPWCFSSTSAPPPHRPDGGEAQPSLAMVTLSEWAAQGAPPSGPPPEEPPAANAEYTASAATRFDTGLVVIKPRAASASLLPVPDSAGPTEEAPAQHAAAAAVPPPLQHPPQPLGHASASETDSTDVSSGSSASVVEAKVSLPHAEPRAQQSQPQSALHTPRPVAASKDGPGMAPPTPLIKKEAPVPKAERSAAETSSAAPKRAPVKDSVPPAAAHTTLDVTHAMAAAATPAPSDQQATSKSSLVQSPVPSYSTCSLAISSTDPTSSVQLPEPELWSPGSSEDGDNTSTTPRQHHPPPGHQMSPNDKLLLQLLRKKMLGATPERTAQPAGTAPPASNAGAARPSYAPALYAAAARPKLYATKSKVARKLQMPDDRAVAANANARAARPTAVADLTPRNRKASGAPGKPRKSSTVTFDVKDAAGAADRKTAAVAGQFSGPATRQQPWQAVADAPPAAVPPSSSFPPPMIVRREGFIRFADQAEPNPNDSELTPVHSEASIDAAAAASTSSSIRPGTAAITGIVETSLMPLSAWPAPSSQSAAAAAPSISGSGDLMTRTLRYLQYLETKDPQPAAAAADAVPSAAAGPDEAAGADQPPSPPSPVRFASNIVPQRKQPSPSQPPPATPKPLQHIINSMNDGVARQLTIPFSGYKVRRSVYAPISTAIARKELAQFQQSPAPVRKGAPTRSRPVTGEGQASVHRQIASQAPAGARLQSPAHAKAALPRGRHSAPGTPQANANSTTPQSYLTTLLQMKQLLTESHRRR